MLIAVLLQSGDDDAKDDASGAQRHDGAEGDSGQADEVAEDQCRASLGEDSPGRGSFAIH